MILKHQISTSWFEINNQIRLSTGRAISTTCLKSRLTHLLVRSVELTHLLCKERCIPWTLRQGMKDSSSHLELKWTHVMLSHQRRVLSLITSRFRSLLKHNSCRKVSSLLNLRLQNTRHTQNLSLIILRRESQPWQMQILSKKSS